MPLLSFIIPCYNKKPELQGLLYSIYYSGLDREDYEVIVSDDSEPSSKADLATETSSLLPCFFINLRPSFVAFFSSLTINFPFI